MSDLRDTVEKLQRMVQASTHELRAHHDEAMKLIDHQAAQIETLLQENVALRRELAALKEKA
jgi:hypothetical protein